MKLATWNIYWLGDKAKEHIARVEEDEHLIGQILLRMAPSVLALQEIVDPAALSRVLGNARKDGYELAMEANGAMLTSSADLADEHQKVFLCFDRNTVEVVAASPIEGGPWGRKPLAVHLRYRLSGVEFTVVALHLRSGYPEFLDKKDASNRREQCEAVASWIRGDLKLLNPGLPEPPTEDVALLGDFNALLDDPNDSLAPLQSADFDGWVWEEPRPDGVHSSTAIDDHLIIDFAVLSPSLAAKQTTPASVYAYDHDHSLGGPAAFYWTQDGSGPLKSYRVSDHRPVFVEVAL